MAYDDRCFDLAKIFLDEEPRINSSLTFRLAQAIQTTIEEWIEDHTQPCDGCGEPIGLGDHSGCVLF